MSYYLLSFSASKYDYDHTSWAMLPVLVKADSLRDAISKVQAKYPDLHLFDFNNLTIE